MIVVLGRPGLRTPEAVGVGGAPPGATRGRPGRFAADVAVAASAAGATVELVGSVGDDPEGDAVVTALGQAGVGHAALLRDPAARTPVTGSGPPDEASSTTEASAAVEATPAADPPREEPPLPRLDTRDVDLGLRYLTEYRVLVIAESLPDDVTEVALEAAAYHDAAVIAVVPAGAASTGRVADAATVLEAPGADDGRFADLVGRYAAGLDRGVAPRDAFREALRATGWEQSEA